MKKLLLIIPFIVGCKTIEVKPAVANVDLKPAQDMNAVKGEVSGEISAIKGDLAAIKGNMDALAKVQAPAALGANNQQTSVAGNMQQTSTVSNDTELMKYIADMWRNIAIALIGIITLLIKQMFTFFKRYMFYKEQTFMRISGEEERQRLKELQYGKKKKEA